jgi:FAD/FMN-containing dehydrogenase
LRNCASSWVDPLPHTTAEVSRILEIELMRTLKLTLDPKGILNRGRIVD